MLSLQSIFDFCFIFSLYALVVLIKYVYILSVIVFFRMSHFIAIHIQNCKYVIFSSFDINTFSWKFCKHQLYAMFFLQSTYEKIMKEKYIDLFNLTCFLASRRLLIFNSIQTCSTQPNKTSCAS